MAWGTAFLLVTASHPHQVLEGSILHQGDSSPGISQGFSSQ